jgi:predicted transcriptional regulator
MNSDRSQKESKSPLKELREMLGMTQVEFSSLTGIPYPRLVKMEQGVQEEKFNPLEIFGLIKAARAAEKDPIQFFEGWAAMRSA